MPSTPKFSLNHMICPKMTMLELLNAASELDVNAVELRNDVGSNSIETLEDAKEIGIAAKERGITILSINALYPFNRWNDERQHQAEALADLAQACDATGLVMCPLNENRFVEASEEKSQGLREALSAMANILQSRNLKGFIEPLGFPVSSLRFKQEAIDAIDAIDEASTFSLVHDTFHHKGAGETSLFADRTGIVHCSGLEESEINFNDMLDEHRVLVGEKDRLDNIGQIQKLQQDGYQGYISFEPFSREVWELENPIAAVQQSMAYLQSGLAKI